MRAPRRARRGGTGDGGAREADPDADREIRTAIDRRQLLRFMLDGLPRLGEPHDYGVQEGVLRLLVYQVGGESRSGIIPGWRLVTVANASRFARLHETFAGSRPVPTRRHQRWDWIIASVSRREPEPAPARGRPAPPASRPPVDGPPRGARRPAGRPARTRPPRRRRR